MTVPIQDTQVTVEDHRLFKDGRGVQRRRILQGNWNLIRNLNFCDDTRWRYVMCHVIYQVMC